MAREHETPQQGPSPEEEGIPDLEESLPAKRRTGDAQEGEMLPGEKPKGAEQHGTTAAEQREGLSQDERLAQEQPDRPPSGSEDDVGRLVEPTERGIDREPQEVAEESGDDEAPSAEEDAVRETP